MSYLHSRKKQGIHDYLLKEIDIIYPHIEGRFLKIWTLPGESLRLERKILRRYRSKVVGVEYNKEVFKKIYNKSQSLPDSRFKIHRMEDLAYWSKATEKFDVIWMDWCGGMTEKRLKSLPQILNRNTYVSSRPKSNLENIFAMTFQDGRDKFAVNFLKKEIPELIDLYKLGKDYGHENDKQLRRYGFHLYLANELQAVGLELVKPRVYSYQNKESGSAPMAFYIARIKPLSELPKEINIK